MRGAGIANYDGIPGLSNLAAKLSRRDREDAWGGYSSSDGAKSTWQAGESSPGPFSPQGLKAMLDAATVGGQGSTADNFFKAMLFKMDGGRATANPAAPNYRESVPDVMSRNQLGRTPVSVFGQSNGGGRSWRGGAGITDQGAGDRQRANALSERMLNDKLELDKFRKQAMIEEEMKRRAQQSKMQMISSLLGEGGRKYPNKDVTTETSQQIVNNAGSWEPRNVTSTTTKTRNYLDDYARLFGMI